MVLEISYGALHFVYAVLLVVFSVAVLGIASASYAGSGFYTTMATLFALKLVVSVLWLVYSVFSLERTGATVLLVVALLGAWLFSWIWGVGLLIDAGTCNGPNGFGNPCNDLLFCCVHHATVAQCAGQGPCPGSGFPQITSDLRANEAFTWLGVLILIQFAVEPLLVLLTFGVHDVRARVSVEKRAAAERFLTAVDREEEEGEKEQEEESDVVEMEADRKAEESENENPIKRTAEPSIAIEAYAEASRLVPPHTVLERFDCPPKSLWTRVRAALRTAATRDFSEWKVTVSEVTPRELMYKAWEHLCDSVEGVVPYRIGLHRYAYCDPDTARCIARRRSRNRRNAQRRRTAATAKKTQ